jgi:hypothetical protein
VDQRGEAHRLGTWLNDGDESHSDVVRRVWDFTVEFARKANVEWRIVIAKLGSMDDSELNGTPSSEHYYLYVTIFSQYSLEEPLGKSSPRMS